jgi:hypothetical protein
MGAAHPTRRHNITPTAMPLSRIQLDIADVLGYVPCTSEEEESPLDIEINFVNDGKAVPFNGAVAIIGGVKQVFWMPQCSSYADDYDDLVGWYELPTTGEFEEWTFDSVCPTPAGDEYEPDHPDSWLSILGMI